MRMYNLREHSGAYSKTWESVWQKYGDEPALNNAGDIIDFPRDNNNTISIKFKQQIIGETGNSGTKNVEIMVPIEI